MSRARRLRLFIRDYVSEFGCAWSIARYRDCERNGGHRWLAYVEDDLLGWSRVCDRCGVSESAPKTHSTGGANVTVWVDPLTTTANVDKRPWRDPGVSGL